MILAFFQTRGILQIPDLVLLIKMADLLLFVYKEMEIADFVEY